MNDMPNEDMHLAVGPCAAGPDRCMDDLCRGSDVGICGALSDRLLGIREDDYDDNPVDDWDV